MYYILECVAADDRVIIITSNQNKGEGLVPRGRWVGEGL